MPLSPSLWNDHFNEEDHVDRKEEEEEPGDLLPAERNRILRKLDWHLMPVVSILYFLSFLDRSNIGFAKVAGMAKDLDLTGYKYNTAAAVFHILYCLAEVPSNIALKFYRPSRWIPTIMLAWGLITTLMCLVNTYKGLLVARIFLGLAEAGLVPGVTYYISLWYPRAEQAKRVAIFFSAATVAGAFGGLLAYGIERMEGVGGLHGWQWIFCLEGIVTVLIAIVSFFGTYDYPATATFLSEPERAHVVHMLKSDSLGQSTHFDMKFVRQALGDYHTYLQIGIYIGTIIAPAAIALFMPTIIHELGYSAANAQLLTVPPFAAACIFIITVGIISDKYKLRGPFIIGGALVSLAGYIVLYNTDKPGAGCVGAVLTAVGVFPTIPVAIAWAGGNAGGDMKRGVVLGMVIGMGSLGGICSSFIYIDPPRFHIGHGTIMGWLSLTIILSAVAMWDYNRLNKQKDALCLREGITEARADEFREMGDDSPLFRYMI
ncbi:MFS general substrate transporter [Athelia psychrophila]|uniref:MFS general substrate transporter n=1 Tax=Athelia psychrophila TaxID=1759441 RepID=A0A166HFM4_9AGAM|nr:MFS general substrate transporter [Fibularhizoctonia sp. CBS 109695]